VFADGKPLPFDRRKTKELLAFLIDRRGATCTAEEIIAALWEDETDTVKAKHRLRNLVNDLRAALKTADAEDVLLRKSGLLAIKADEIDCDYYRMLSGDADAAKSFHGAYMSQYSWAEPTAGRLWFEQGGQA
jgi:DNA-binding SARP family transcriptional activator